MKNITLETLLCILNDLDIQYTLDDESILIEDYIGFKRSNKMGVLQYISFKLNEKVGANE